MNKFDKVYFKSKTVGKLSSHSLDELKSTLLEIEGGKKKLRAKIGSITKDVGTTESELSWIN